MTDEMYALQQGDAQGAAQGAPPAGVQQPANNNVDLPSMYFDQQGNNGHGFYPPPPQQYFNQPYPMLVLLNTLLYITIYNT